MPAPGAAEAGSQRVRDKGLLCLPDHIQELWHSEAIRAVISYWAAWLLYVWAKFLICSGKTFYHDTREGFILHRKHQKISSCRSVLWSILYPVSWILYTAIYPSHKGYSWPGEGTGKLWDCFAWQHDCNASTWKQDKEAQRVPMKPFWHGDGGQDWQ